MAQLNELNHEQWFLYDPNTLEQFDLVFLVRAGFTVTDRICFHTKHWRLAAPHETPSVTWYEHLIAVSTDAVKYADDL